MTKPNPTLKEIQSWLQEAVTHPEGTTFKAESIVTESAKGPTARERIGVYSAGWFIRLEESLRDDYPKVFEVLGDEKWGKFLHSYLREIPSSSFDLAKAGEQLPEFLIDWDVSLRATPVYQLAILERSLLFVRTIKDFELWNVSELQTMTMAEAETLSFELVPGVRLHEFDWNVDEMKWQNAEPVRGPRKVVVYRHDFAPTYEDVSQEEFDFLIRCSKTPFLTDLIQEFEGSDWMQWLARFAEDGIVRKNQG